MGTVLYQMGDLAKYKGKKAVLLYSGGVDSMYAALSLVQSGIDVHALRIDIGQSPSADLKSNVEKIGVKLVEIDAKNELCDSYIRIGIAANGLYNHHYPISSSYTRPLIASKAVHYAQNIGSQLIAHSATPVQNSASRFNMSILALAPEIDIYCSAILEYADRDNKISYLKSRGLTLVNDHELFSVDENLWARVVESGTLEQHWLNMSVRDVFTWTKIDKSAKPISVNLRFEEGIAVELDGQALPLVDIILRLNEKLSKYGIGRYSGFEDNAFGVKNREVREAPAAVLLHSAHRLFEEMILSGDELRVKHFLDVEWVNLVVGGGWFSSLKGPLDAAILAFNKDINGTATWEVDHGSLICKSIKADASLASAQYPRFSEEIKGFTIESFYKHLARKMRIGTKRPVH
ncbi:argininosuccinate synthase domain-containing protein [Cohnella soli]|uniref:argininosuccinate synthase n=1 Tax=Cohnella soli TaxID=425005 RepID=A0ABW0I1G3_9BACL